MKRKDRNKEERVHAAPGGRTHQVLVLHTHQDTVRHPANEQDSSIWVSCSVLWRCFIVHLRLKERERESKALSVCDMLDLGHSVPKTKIMKD